MTTEKSIAQILREAAAIVERGWCQGKYARNGGVCLMGAINLAAHGEVIGWDPVAELAEETMRHVLRDFSTDARLTTAWNDAPGRTKAEVAAKLLEAAALAEQDDAA